MGCSDYYTNIVQEGNYYQSPMKPDCEECVCNDGTADLCKSFYCIPEKCNHYESSKRCCPIGCDQIPNRIESKGRLEASSLLLLFVVLVFFLVTIIRMKRRGFCSNILNFSDQPNSDDNMWQAYDNNNNNTRIFRPDLIFTNRAYNNDQRNLGNSDLPDDLNDPPNNHPSLPNNVLPLEIGLPPRYENVAKTPKDELPAYEEPPPYCKDEYVGEGDVVVGSDGSGEVMGDVGAVGVGEMIENECGGGGDDNGGCHGDSNINNNNNNLERSDSSRNFDNNNIANNVSYNVVNNNNNNITNNNNNNNNDITNNNNNNNNNITNNNNNINNNNNSIELCINNIISAGDNNLKC